MTSALHQEWLADKADEIERQRLMAQASPQMRDALYVALPFVEDAMDDAGYKPGVVQRAVNQIRAAIAAAEGKQ